MTKEDNLWRNVFGKSAFTVQMIPGKEKDKDAGLTAKRESYVQMVQSAGSVQFSMGSANIHGLIQFNKKYTLRRKNADETDAPTIRKSVQAVMRYQTLDRDNIWLAAIPRCGGGVTGYFSSVLPEIKSYIEQWTQCPAAQIYWFLLRKGCNYEDVSAMKMDSEQNDKADATGEGGQSVKKGELSAEDADNEEQRAYDLKQDEAFHNRIPVSETFYGYMWNKAGPNLGAMGILVEHMADRIDVDKQAGIKQDLIQYKISHNLHDSLELKGDTWQERKGFLQEIIQEIKEREKQQNPGETQDTTDVRTTLHL